MQLVDANVFADFFYAQGRSDEFLADRRIDTVEARIHNRRCRYAHVDFLSTGFAEHLTDNAARRAADDGVVNHDDTLALDDGFDDVRSL